MHYYFCDLLLVEINYISIIVKLYLYLCFIFLTDNDIKFCEFNLYAILWICKKFQICLNC